MIGGGLELFGTEQAVSNVTSIAVARPWLLVQHCGGAAAAEGSGGGGRRRRRTVTWQPYNPLQTSLLGRDERRADFSIWLLYLVSEVLPIPGFQTPPRARVTSHRVSGPFLRVDWIT